MEQIVNAAQMKAIDTFTIKEIGIPSLVLMERAAAALADCVEEYLQGASGRARAGKVSPRPCLTAAVCGYGNNGGDGIAAARILAYRGWPVEIYMIGNPQRATQEVSAQLQIVRKSGIPVREFGNETKLAAYTVIIDAIFGIGLSRPAEGVYARAVERINESGAYIAAADIASGISADSGAVLGTAVRADVTVAFGYRKLGQLLFPGAEYTGRLITADIGFPSFAARAVLDGRQDGVRPIFAGPMKAGKAAEYAALGPEDLKLLPVRAARSNKGTYGRVLVCAGSASMCGAAYLSAAAAYHTGAGLVRILTEKSNYTALAELLPEALLTCYDGKRLEEEEACSLDMIREAADWCDVAVLGPGIGTGRSGRVLTDTVLERLKQKNAGAGRAGAQKRCVIDADALNLLSGQLGAGLDASGRVAALARLLPEDAVITPHMKELSRILELPVPEITARPADMADLCTAGNRLICVLKDARTITAYQSMRFVNTAGNEGMATGGSGDVLTGIIAALMAGGCSPFIAAGLGVYLHARAGDAAAQELSGRYMVAGDIIRYLSGILKEAQEQKEGERNGNDRRRR